MLRILTALVLMLGLVVPLGAAPAGVAAQSETVIVQIDNPAAGEQNMSPAWIAGWAVDTAVTDGTGVDMVAVYMDGDMTTGTFLGMAEYGGDREDVAFTLGNPAYRYSGFTLNFAEIAIPAGPHTFTVVVHSATSGYAMTSVAGVSVAPSSQATLMPPPPPAGFGMGNPALPQIGNQPGQPLQSTAPTSSPDGDLEISAALSNVSFLVGQNYWSTLQNYNGYLAPNLVLPNGTVVNNGTMAQNGQLYWNGNYTSISPFLQPVTTGMSNNSAFAGAYTYHTALPNGQVVQYNTPYGYWNGFNGWVMPSGTTQIAGSGLATQDTIYLAPYGNGYRANVVLPSNLQGGQIISSGATGVIPGTNIPANTSNTPWWNNYNFAGNSATQATVVARVTMNGQPVPGAEVMIGNYRLPMTDANGLTSGTVLLPVDLNTQAGVTVTATYDGQTASIPVYVGYNQP